MVCVLELVNKLDRDWKANSKNEEMQAAKAFFDTLVYREQVFGFSWITNVDYTLPYDGKIDPALLNVPGLGILELGYD